MDNFEVDAHNRRTFDSGKPLSGLATRLYAALSDRLILPPGKFSVRINLRCIKRMSKSARSVCRLRPQHCGTISQRNDA